jgi:glycosyltransferase involved in cell wall biosynthesis
MIPMNARRFVMSCEMELPRYLGNAHSWQNRIGYRLLRSNACRAILGLSEIACRQSREKFVGLGLPNIADKIQLFRGTLRKASSVPFRDRNMNGPLKLLFVGRNALRKGLIPTLNAIEELRSGGVDVRLTVVSSIDSSDDYIYDDAKELCREVRQQIEKRSWVVHHESAPNETVRRMMREHDLLILPTFDESLGWVLVEAGIEGCPSISTNIFAIPELIDDGETGRLLSLPLSANNRWYGLGQTDDAKRDAIRDSQSLLRRQIIESIDAIASNRDCLNRWGEAALEKMDNMFNRDRSTQQLRTIYDNACD